MYVCMREQIAAYVDRWISRFCRCLAQYFGCAACRLPIMNSQSSLLYENPFLHAHGFISKFPPCLLQVLLVIPTQFRRPLLKIVLESWLDHSSGMFARDCVSPGGDGTNCGILNAARSSWDLNDGGMARWRHEGLTIHFQIDQEIVTIPSLILGQSQRCAKGNPFDPTEWCFPMPWVHIQISNAHGPSLGSNFSSSPSFAPSFCVRRSGGTWWNQLLSSTALPHSRPDGHFHHPNGLGINGGWSWYGPWWLKEWQQPTMGTHV